MTTLVIGPDTTDVEVLLRGLDAELLALPPASPPGEDPLAWPWAPALERWRVEASDGPTVDRVVVAAWSEPVPEEPCPLDATDLAGWADRAEQPIARWFAALGVAVQRCADGGVVVAVVDRPPPLDSAGWAPESAVADAVETLVRSLARSEGPRGVRVATVGFPHRLHHPPIVPPPPPLATFPGRLDVEVLGAVRLLLSKDAAGLTGTVLHADEGRS